MTSHQQLLREQLQENLRLLDQSLDALEYSQKKCSSLNPSSFESPEELESWEALTARFARTADIFTQKVCKSLFLVLQENIVTFLDGAHFLEKIGIVSSSDEIIQIRELRNEISHEYADPEHIYEVFSHALHKSTQLVNIIKKTKTYIQGLP